MHQWQECGNTYLRICVSAYLGDNKITKKSRKIKKESLDTIWKKMFLRVLMRICVSVYFLKKSQPKLDMKSVPILNIGCIRSVDKPADITIECPGKWNLLSACLLICRFFFWREKSTDLKSVDMLTNVQIRFFSADRRPGTIFLRRLSPRGSELFLFPEDRLTHHPVTGYIALPKTQN